MKTYLLVRALGAGIGAVGNIYRISSSKKDASVDARRSWVQAVCVGVGAVVFVVGVIGVVISWN